MKKLALFIVLISLFSCSETDRLTYDLNTHDIYLRDVKDSLFVSLKDKGNVFAYPVPVSLLGSKLSKTKKFRVEVVPEGTTAIEGKHYKKLPDYFEFPLDTVVFNMPIECLKGDPEIKTKPVSLTIRLIGTDEMGIAYKDRALARLVIAEMIMPPSDDDLKVFEELFGAYSQVKHQMIINLAGHDFWDGDYGYAGGLNGLYFEKAYYKPYARRLYKTVMEAIAAGNPLQDENKNDIKGWNVV